MAFVCGDVSRDPCGYIGSSQFGASARNEFISGAFGIGRGCNIEFNAQLSGLPSALTALNASFTRASVKNVLQGSSLVQLTTNQFGTSKDPLNGIYGAWIESAATNILTYSEQFDNAIWSKVQSTVTANAAVAPDGNTTADKLTPNAILAQHRVELTSTSTAATYTFSVFLKAAGYNYAFIRIGATAGMVANLTNGVTASTGTASNFLAESYGNGWYRCSFSCTAGVNDVVRINAEETFGSPDFVGDGTSGIYMWGAQLETGTLSSYIATTSATVTRAAEKLVVPLWKNNVLYSQDPTGTGWVRTNTTLTAGQSDPFGGTTAWKAEATTTAVTNFYINGSNAASTTVNASVYVYGGVTASGTINFILRNGTTATNFTQGTFTNATGAISGAGWTSTAVPGYAGWYRLTFTQASGISVGDSLNFQLGFTTTCTAGDWFRYCAPQIEPGSTATTYIPTTSTLDVTGNANIPGFSTAGYALFADFRSMAARTTAAGLIELNDNSGSNRSNLLISNSDLFNPNSVTGGASQMSIAGSACTATRRKGAASYQVNNFLAANNGTALTPDTSGTMPTGMYLLNLGSLSTGGSPFNGYTYRLQLIPKVLTQAQLNGLTQ